MEKTSREKIALIVFLVLAIGMGFILFGYVFAGHSWNVTASNIDDAFGNMEGYTAIVYEGTIEEEESAAQSSASATSAANGSANSKNAGDAKSLPGDSKAGDGQASASSSDNSRASSAASSSDKQVASSQGGSSVNTASPTSVSAQGNGSLNQGVSTASEPAAAEGSASEGIAGQGVSTAVSPDGTLNPRQIPLPLLRDIRRRRSLSPSPMSTRSTRARGLTSSRFTRPIFPPMKRERS